MRHETLAPSPSSPVAQAPGAGSAYPQDTLRQSTILLVDDMEFNLLMLTEMLRQRGFSRVLYAPDGQRALELLDAQPIDLVISDLMMPSMNGYELLRAMRAHAEWASIPVLVQTALAFPEQRTTAFEAGASDFIIKPVDSDELIARTLVHLERRKLIQALRASHERIEQELADAQAMQRMLLPSERALEGIRERCGISIVHHVQTSSEMGGDVWGARAVEGDRLAVYVVDFSGHGVTAALNTFRLHTLLHEYTEDMADPSRLLERLNRRLSDLLTIGQYCTMFYGIIDRQQQTLTYATAAAPSPLILRMPDCHAEIVDGRGFPLGIHRKADYPQTVLPFHEGDALLLYSDALIETEDAQGEFFHLEAIAEYLQQAYRRTPHHQEAFRSLLEHFNVHYAPRLHDDLTVNLYT